MIPHGSVGSNNAPSAVRIPKWFGETIREKRGEQTHPRIGWGERGTSQVPLREGFDIAAPMGEDGRNTAGRPKRRSLEPAGNFS